MINEVTFEAKTDWQLNDTVHPKDYNKLEQGIEDCANAINSTKTEHVENKNNPHSVTKEQVGLGNVNNTADADKPLSAAQKNALQLKADKDLANTGFISGCILSAPNGVIAGAEGSKTISAKDQLTVLFPAGLNEDGTLKSEKFTLSGNRTLSITSAYATVLHKIILTKNIITSTILANYFVSETTPQTEIKNYKFWFNPKENKTYVGNESKGKWTEVPFVVLGEFQQSNGAINYFKSYAPIVLNQPNFDYVVESYYDASGNWYRKYKSGWVEQGGKTTPLSAGAEVSFLLPFSKTQGLFLHAENNLYVANTYNASSTAVTTTGFIPYLWNSRGERVNGAIFWYACGQGA